ncbi:MAG: DUF1571 domain-containing protein [bacterium]|nr:DUF1571 domain-containing protein [bacterium]
MKKAILTLLILGLLCTELAAEEKISIDTILTKTIASYEKLNDYTCILNKRELIKGKILEQKNIMVKFKKPLCIYLKWTEGADKGNEAIYVQGKYKNELQVHMGGFLNVYNFSLDPKGSIAMKNNRHAITEAYIGQISYLIKNNYDLYKKSREGSITYEGIQELDGEKTMLFKAIFPEGKGYYAHRMMINIDAKTYLPIRTEIYGWQNEFLEMYYYSNIKINTGLTDKDFDIDNPEYHF